MALLDQDTVLTIFGNHVYAVRAAIRDAWGDYQTENSDRLKLIYGRTARANCVHDLAKDRLSRLAQATGGELYVRVINRMFVVVVQNRLACRIKKLDRTLKTSNARTKQVLAFKGQQCLPGLPDTCNLEIGYQLNKAEREIAAVHLVCPNGGDAYFWAGEITEQTVTQTFGDLFPIRTPATAPQTEEEALVVRPKKDGVVVPIRRDTKPEDDRK